eukprot:NODE_4046_length_850_cov_24.467497_g3889_i0.p1 GENE.NODE_4046_length_850_cov_24.467497_g3889_i0~~NODE_4046_length_850_cov_24.467497_g3889_i0.p1  ORF type:complete len:276 (-),score=82.79 NODE_4046_length_850_cov_24.467497_g3889_i0:22-813(-)
MPNTILLSALLFVVAAVQHVTIEYNDCGDKTDLVSNIKPSWEPKSPVLGEDVNIHVSGNLSETLTGGTYTVKGYLKAGWIPIPVLSHTHDICIPDVIEFPMGLGQLRFTFPGCPLKPGPTAVDGLVTNTPKSSVGAKMELDVTALSDKQAQLFCAKLMIQVLPSGAEGGNVTTPFFGQSCFWKEANVCLDALDPTTFDPNCQYYGQVYRRHSTQPAIATLPKPGSIPGKFVYSPRGLGCSTFGFGAQVGSLGTQASSGINVYA